MPDLSLTLEETSHAGATPIPRQVCIVQRIVPHYRVPFFRGLQSRLAQGGVQLRLIHGQEFPGTVPRSVSLDEDWSVPIHNRYIRVANRELIWQPGSMRLLRAADLVIVEHANRLLLNYLLLGLRGRRRRVAFWGHGANYQAGAGKTGGGFLARSLARRADWWFAYTRGGAALVESYGYPRDRLTVVNNSIDSRRLGAAVADCSVEERRRLRAQLALPESGVGIFCGRLVAEKRFDLLWKTALELRRRRPDFSLLIVGEGPLEAEVRAMAASHAWIHHLGPRAGQQLAPYLAVSDFVLIPGLVGLVVVDAFAAGLPLVTTQLDIHSPEIEYLQPGVNGLMTPPRGAAIAEACDRLLGSPETLHRMRAACLETAREFGIEQMVERFARGVFAALTR